MPCNYICRPALDVRGNVEALYNSCHLEILLFNQYHRGKTVFAEIVSFLKSSYST